MTGIYDVNRPSAGDLVKGKRCDGTCCRRFTMPAPYDVLKADYEAALRGERHRWLEIEAIFPLLVPLETDSRTRPNGDPAPEGQPFDIYTCNQFDPVFGLCKIYEKRPDMCRDFPYGEPCEHHTCTSHSFIRRWPLTRPLWRWKERLMAKVRAWRDDHEVRLRVPWYVPRLARDWWKRRRLGKLGRKVEAASDEVVKFQTVEDGEA